MTIRRYKSLSVGSTRNIRCPLRNPIAARLNRSRLFGIIAFFLNIVFSFIENSLTWAMYDTTRNIDLPECLIRLSIYSNLFTRRNRNRLLHIYIYIIMINFFSYIALLAYYRSHFLRLAQRLPIRTNAITLPTEHRECPG